VTSVRARAALITLVAAWIAIWEVRTIVAPDLEIGPLFSRWNHVVGLLVTAGLCLGRGFARDKARTAWLLIGGGVLAWSIAELYYTAVIWGMEEVPVPSPADAGYLLTIPLLLSGIVVLRGRASGLPPTLWADGFTAALGVMALCTALVAPAVLDALPTEPLAVATNLAYPIGDLLLLGVIVGVLASTGWQADRRWLLLVAGVGFFWVADSAYLVQVARGTYVFPSPWDAGWWLGLLLIAAAAWQPVSEHPVRTDRARLIVVPLAFSTIGLGLLIYGCLADLAAPAIVLAAASLLAIMWRLILTFRENIGMVHASREEALTDALTGLGNRRALGRELARLLPQACEERPLVLMIFDLDGFKHYNDTFGHPAGDALLKRLGSRLEAHLRGRGCAFRMGGDEFCALLVLDADVDPAPVAAGAALALSEYGEGFTITCSQGAITLPREAGEPSEALRIADQRMYANKHAGRSSASRQSTDVLLRALAERHPDLGQHLAGVAELAEATARRLGLAADEIAEVHLAAELHDVGKVAVPDSILSKPGPLDEQEWDFIRRHTLVGERIIAAAPALGRVARLVRSSHERWDGNGYPDRLAGDAIPLGARIVAVADAFDAMTAARPYHEPREPEAALEELRACAGTQFDPAVVEAFTAAWRAVGVPVAA